MCLEKQINSITVFKGDTGLALSLFSNRNANGTYELDKIVDNISSFYKELMAPCQITISKNPKIADDKISRLYSVFLSYSGDSDNPEKQSFASQKKEYFGTVKITPKGVFSKPNVSHEDFTIADQTTYGENYFIYFFPKEKSERGLHRDGYVTFLDPSSVKTK